MIGFMDAAVEMEHIQSEAIMQSGETVISGCIKVNCMDAVKVT